MFVRLRAAVGLGYEFLLPIENEVGPDPDSVQVFHIRLAAEPVTWIHLV